MPKFFVLPEQVEEDKIILKGEDAKHIATVLRGKPEDIITVCDGNGMDYKCKLNSVNAKSVEALITERKYCDVEPKTTITLFQGLPKADKMELIIQKCIELGVDEIIPVMTERTVVKFGSDEKEKKKIERWQKIAESAAKQSGRGKITKIGQVCTLKQALEKASQKDGILLPYEEEKERTLKDFFSVFEGNSLALFIGPEGGFSKEEIEMASKKKAIIVTLGKRILRTETAGMSVLSVLYYELG